MLLIVDSLLYMKENWAELESLLKQVCADIAGTIGSEHHGEILNYIENREFGIAYEDIVWLTRNENLELSSAAAASLLRAGRLMGLDLPPDTG